MTIKDRLSKDIEIIDVLINNAMLSLNTTISVTDSAIIRNQICDMIRLKRDFYQQLEGVPRETGTAICINKVGD